MDEAAAIEEESCALRFGELVLALVAARSKRSIALLMSWPSRSILLLGNEQEVAETIAALRRDYEHFVRIEALAGRGNSRAQLLLKRTVMRLLPVEQICAALRLSPGGAWTMNDELRRWLLVRARKQVGSIVCEGAFNLQKNANTVKGTRRYLNPAKASYLLVKEKVVHRL